MRPWKPPEKATILVFGSAETAVLTFAYFPRKFKRRFVGFCAGVAEVNFVGERVGDKFLCQFNLRGAVVQVADVGEGGGLRGNGRYPIRITMSQRCHGNARGQVEIFVAFAVVQIHAFPV